MLVSKAATRDLITKGWMGWSQLRASNEGLHRPRVARPREPSQLPRRLFSGSCCYSTTTAVPLALTISIVLLVPIVS
jgi:hypothetical protein